MDRWTEIRTAYQVAKFGTVSAAADNLGIHRATVIRHIDALEAELGGKVFQRHARGYTVTEVGEDLMRVAQRTEEHFDGLAGRTRGRAGEITGELIVTSPEGSSSLLLPVISSFQHLNPQMTVKYRTGPELFRLEYGEAHVAVRAGRKPTDPDNVVLPFVSIRRALYAHKHYLQSFDMKIPETKSEYAKHTLVTSDGNSFLADRFKSWISDNIPDETRRFISTSYLIGEEAVYNGIGIGFCPTFVAAERPGLVMIAPPREEWDVKLWILSHGDVFRTAKVQGFLKLLRDDDYLSNFSFS